MNNYGFFVSMFFLLNVNIFNSLTYLKKNMQMTMKKTKRISLPLYIPKTKNQEKYVNYLNNYNTKIIITTGPAGCGKTLFACQKAITQIKNEELNKIIITRPVVSVDEEIGFLPGNIIKKMDPWTKPIFDIFLDHFSKTELDVMLSNGKIEICPLAFMRGRTFKDSFIIADEMQNSSPNQMKMLTTRLGMNSRMVITGDLAQTDFIKENGLYNLVERLKNINETSELIRQVYFDNNDIERSFIVKKMIDIYDQNYSKPIKSKPIKTRSIKNETVITKPIKSKPIKTRSVKNETVITKPIKTRSVKNDTVIRKPVKNETVKNDTEKINGNNDAALIPIFHTTKYYDIFTDKMLF
jgi:phosphate starvation-inducible PhoH-like protein